MKIRKKITITFMAIMLLALLMVSLVSYITVKNILTRNALHNLESISTAQLNYLENIDEQNLERLKLVSSRTQLRLSLKEYNQNSEKQYLIKIEKILKDARSSIPDFKEISVINLEGITIASTNEESIGTEHLNKDYFLRGQKENSTNLFFLDKDLNFNINFCGPLIMENELLGVLLIISSGDKITNFVTDYSLLGETGYTFLVMKTDEQNKFIVSLRRINGENTKYEYASYNDFGQISKKVIAKQKGTYKIIYDYLNEPMSAVVNYSDKLEIGFSVRLSREEILKPVIRYGNILAIISILSLLVMFIYTSLSARSITTPILKLTNLTKEISEGDLDQKIEINSKDEIGILSEAFNTMADNLKQDINARKQAEEELKQHRKHLEELVKERTKELEEKTKTLEKSQQSLVLLLADVNESRAELDISNKKLEDSNKELEAFSYSVSHDLRAPLRHIDGFSKLLNKNIQNVIDEKSQNYFDNIIDSSKQMNQLIDDLLIFSRLSRKDMKKIKLNMKTVVDEAILTFDSDIEKNKISITVDDMPDVNLDASLMRQAWVNLISNVVKFTGKNENPEIHIGTDKDKDGNTIFFIRDNGVGFDQKYVDKIFDVFQRLHNINEFPGTGIGLANVKRIITKHGGDIRAEGKINKGASFFFTLSEA